MTRKGSTRCVYASPTKGLSPESSIDQLRVDRWLWNTRFFKTRSAAMNAVRGGHVRVNGERVKPARPLKVNDTVRIVKGLFEWTVVVAQIPNRRGPAQEAQACYAETEASRSAREKRAIELRLDRDSHPRPERRPDKRDRRLLRERRR